VIDHPATPRRWHCALAARACAAAHPVAPPHGRSASAPLPAGTRKHHRVPHLHRALPHCTAGADVSGGEDCARTPGPPRSAAPKWVAAQPQLLDSSRPQGSPEGGLDPGPPLAANDSAPPLSSGANRSPWQSVRAAGQLVFQNPAGPPTRIASRAISASLQPRVSPADTFLAGREVAYLAHSRWRAISPAVLVPSLARRLGSVVLELA
jgi:hypothetical protein